MINGYAEPLIDIYQAHAFRRMTPKIALSVVYNIDVVIHNAVIVL